MADCQLETVIWINDKPLAGGLAQKLRRLWALVTALFHFLSKWAFCPKHPSGIWEHFSAVVGCTFLLFGFACFYFAMRFLYSTWYMAKSKGRRRFGSALFFFCGYVLVGFGIYILVTMP